MGLNISSPKYSGIYTFKTNKNCMHKRNTSSSKYKVATTAKDQEVIDQMKYIEAKINKLMIEQVELDNKINSNTLSTRK